MRPLPGLDIAVPADRRQTRQAVEALAADPRPTYLRIGRTKTPDVTTEADAWERGRFTVAREGADVTLIGLGTTVSRALAAADELAADGVDARVLNAAWVSPLDREAIVAAASETRAIVVAEEANVSGGLGAAVAQIVAQLGVRTKVIPVGLTEFAPTGSTEWLLDHFGLTAANIARVAKEAL
jgi:transketolase